MLTCLSCRFCQAWWGKSIQSESLQNWKIKLESDNQEVVDHFWRNVGQKCKMSCNDAPNFKFKGYDNTKCVKSEQGSVVVIQNVWVVKKINSKKLLYLSIGLSQ